jgi:hypothetical protein
LATKRRSSCQAFTHSITVLIATPKSFAARFRDRPPSTAFTTRDRKSVE